jgi:hypothetical protein
VRRLLRQDSAGLQQPRGRSAAMLEAATRAAVMLLEDAAVVVAAEAVRQL